jgi:hypothetical protein
VLALSTQGGADIGADGVLGFGARQEQMAAAKAEKRARLDADLKQQIAEKQARRVSSVEAQHHIKGLPCSTHVTVHPQRLYATPALLTFPQSSL